MSIRVYIPRDSSALSLGAESVAGAVALEAARRKADITIVRNGSRGLYWLEPMVEVETAQGRVAYGPVSMKDVAALFGADFLHGGRHALCLGPTEKIPYLQKQERLTFARVGITDPLSLADYAAHGGWKGLHEALAMHSATAVKQVTDSGLRGRGGAAFPAGIKWKTVLDTSADQKYVAENAAAEGHLHFYASRAWEIDPVLAGLAPLALGYCLYRKRYVEAGWLGVSVLTLFGFGYRNATYLLPVFAAAALAAGVRVPAAAAGIVLGFRLLTGGISHAAPEAVGPAAALTEYKALGRPNGLIIDGVADEFTATTMHLARVQYMLPGDARTLAATNIDLAGRGIIAEAGTYRGLAEPLETVLLVRSAAEMQTLLNAAGDRDFLLRAERLGALQLGQRTLFGPRNGWVAALAVR